MRFSQLLQLPYEARTDKIYISELLDRLPNFPQEILRDFLADHGRKDDFQEQYAHIDLLRIKWLEQRVAAENLIECALFGRFMPRFAAVTARPDSWSEKGWGCVDPREQVINYWRKHKTWQRKPIFLNGALMFSEKDYYLVEGHTRLGLLKGLIGSNVVSRKASHSIWFGCYKDA